MIYLFYTGIVFYLFSIIVFQFYDKIKSALLFLFLGCLFYAVYVCNLDKFLYFWDEEFHALVAKHLMKHPLTPMLYLNPVFDVDYKRWDINQLWLHKQPLFMWQMVLSMKIFGVNQLAVRLPSAFMFALLVVPIYRMGKIVINKTVGYYASLFFSLSYFLHELATGFFATDHNDFAFMFYITCSFWAFMEYEYSKNRKWLILIGVFSGCAILVKWLVGLLIYAGWTISVLLNKEKRKALRSYLDVGISLLFTTIFALPWQIFTWIRYPAESWYEYSYARSHFTKALDGHDGDSLYQFNAMNELYGHGQNDAVKSPYIPGIIILFIAFLFLRIKNNSIRICLIFTIILVYFFYTFAETKMLGYCLIICFIGYLAIGSAIEYLFSFILKKIHLNKIVFASITTILLFAACYEFGGYDLIRRNHIDSLKDPNSFQYITSEDTKYMKLVGEKLKSKDYVVFNWRRRECIAAMFYGNYTAYDSIPDESKFVKLKSQNIKMAFNDNGQLPEYIKKDTSVIRIKAPF